MQTVHRGERQHTDLAGTWSAAEDTELRALLKRGTSFGDVALLLGRDVAEVRSRVAALWGQPPLT
jgi:hypothetical protein